MNRKFKMVRNVRKHGLQNGTYSDFIKGLRNQAKKHFSDKDWNKLTHRF